MLSKAEALKKLAQDGFYSPKTARAYTSVGMGCYGAEYQIMLEMPENSDVHSTTDFGYWLFGVEETECLPTFNEPNGGLINVECYGAVDPQLARELININK
jgi:hypothetical protein